MHLRTIFLLLLVPGICISQPIQVTHDDSLYHQFQNAVISSDGEILLPLYTFGFFSGGGRKGSIIAYDTASLSYTETDITVSPDAAYRYYPEWIFPAASGYYVFGQAQDTLSWDVQMMMLKLDQSLNIVQDSLIGLDSLDEVLTGILFLDSTFILTYYATDSYFPQSYGLMEMDLDWNLLRSCDPPKTSFIECMTYNAYTNEIILLTPASAWYALDYNSFEFDTIPHTYPTSLTEPGNFLCSRGSEGYFQSGYFLNQSFHLPNTGWRGASVSRDTTGLIVQFSPHIMLADTPGISAARSVLFKSADTIIMASFSSPEFASDPYANPRGNNYFQQSWIHLCSYDVNGNVHWETRIGGGRAYESLVLLEGSNDDYYVVGIIEEITAQLMKQALFVARFDMDGNVITTTYENLPPISLSLFPNPANKVINLDLNTPINEKASCEAYVVDMRGRKMDRFEFRASMKTLSIDVANYPPGTYAVQVEMSNYRLSRKFVVAP